MIDEMLDFDLRELLLRQRRHTKRKSKSKLGEPLALSIV